MFLLLFNWSLYIQILSKTALVPLSSLSRVFPQTLVLFELFLNAWLFPQYIFGKTQEQCGSHTAKLEMKKIELLSMTQQFLCANIQNKGLILKNIYHNLFLKHLFGTSEFITFSFHCFFDCLWSKHTWTFQLGFTTVINELANLVGSLTGWTMSSPIVQGAITWGYGFIYREY